MAWDEIIKKRFKYVGENVFIGQYCVFTNPSEVVLHDFCRIDPYCLVTTQLELHGYNQICAGAVLSGGPSHKITLGKGAFIGYGSKLFCASEDYSGKGAVGDFWFENEAEKGDIEFKEYSGIASDVMCFPGVTFPEGCCIGAKSLVMTKQHLTPWSVWWGIPLAFKATRQRPIIKIKDKWKSAQ